MKLTRRSLTRILAATAVVPLEAVAQNPSPDPDEELRAARGRMRSDAAILAKFPLPKITEPAFRFKA